MYFIAETFESIQGEGNCAGVNSLFIRFQYCNLSCSWCDTKFTWHKNEKIKAVSVEKVRQIIEQSSATHVILTGGEPALYELDKLVVEGKKYHVETNGTIIPTVALDLMLRDEIRFVRSAMDEAIVKKFNWVVSPKMTNAGQEINEDAMHFFAKANWGIFKFIIQDKKDLSEIESVVKRFAINPLRVYVGLEGSTLESQLKPDLVNEIIRSGYNFSPRLHILLWGNKRKK